MSVKRNRISSAMQAEILRQYDLNPATSIKKIAEMVGCAQQTANTYLKAAGRETNRRRFRKKTSYIDADGYRVIYAPEHFAAKSNGGIREHVWIVCNLLGRRLKDNEVVHHINGDKIDNRNCNLLLCDKGYHSSLHWRMSQLYAKEHFRGL